MSTAGRPSKDIADRQFMVDMIHLWVARKGRRSARSLSRIVVGLEVVSSYKTPEISLNDDSKDKPKLTSTAKRLERRFLKLTNNGEAEALLGYIRWNMERVILRNLEHNETNDMHHIDASIIAARELQIEVAELRHLALQGWEIMESWLPNKYVKPTYDR